MRKRIRIIRLLLLPLMLLATACNDGDDLDAIFIGQTWKLSCVRVSTSQNALSEENQRKINESANDCFILTFEENQFSGRTASKAFSGTWTVDGDSRSIAFNIQNAASLTATDEVSRQMINILKNATYYEGDTHQLSIHQASGPYLLFYPLKN